MASYCAIPRDYLSDTPLLRAMGFWVSQHDRLGAIPPPPFLSISPLESMRSGGALKTRQMGAIPPSAMLSRNYYLEKVLRDRGGISHWVAKPLPSVNFARKGGPHCRKPPKISSSLLGSLPSPSSFPCFFFLFRFVLAFFSVSDFPWLVCVFFLSFPRI